MANRMKNRFIDRCFSLFGKIMSKIDRKHSVKIID